MSTTYRAAYITRGVGIVLTHPDQAGLPDAELRAAAQAEAMNAGLIGSDRDAHQMTREEFDAALVIGDWTEAA